MNTTEELAQIRRRIGGVEHELEQLKRRVSTLELEFAAVPPRAPVALSTAPEPIQPVVVAPPPLPV